MSSLHDVQLWRLLYWCLLWSHTLWLFCEHAYRFTEHKCFLLLSLTSVLFTTILSFNICLWGATIVHDKTPTFTFLLHNWIIKLCLKIKNKSCPDKELVSVPRELLMLIHWLKKIKLIHNSFSSKTKKFNLEQGKEQSGWILNFRFSTAPAWRNYQQIFDIQHV